MGDSKPGRAAVGPWVLPTEAQLLGSDEIWGRFTRQYHDRQCANRFTCYARQDGGEPIAIRQWGAWKLYIAVLRIKGEL